MHNILFGLVWMAAITWTMSIGAQNIPDSIPPIIQVVDTSSLEGSFSTAIGGDSVPKIQSNTHFLKSFTSEYPKPRTAAISGLIFPGGGQLYNKDWWKVPIAWAGYGGIAYLIRQNTMEYRSFRDAVSMRLNQESDPYPQFSLPGLRRQRDFYRKNMERAYIGLVAVHVLSALEAFVACHLDQFDISDQLSIGVGSSKQIPFEKYPSTTLFHIAFQF